ncbi:MAG TPA: hypothetical protein VF115_10160 [Acidimicrobiia bacterium]
MSVILREVDADLPGSLWLVLVPDIQKANIDRSVTLPRIVTSISPYLGVYPHEVRCSSATMRPSRKG